MTILKEELWSYMALVVDEFHKKDQTLLFMQHIASEQSSFFRPNTNGVALHSIIEPYDGDLVFQKNYPNSFRETELLKYLKAHEIKNLIICGMMTHMCVDTTVRAAYDLGFNCILIGDACATRNLEFNGRTIDSREVQAAYLGAIDGTFAKVMDAQEFLKTLK